MVAEGLQVSLWDLVAAVSRGCDMMDPALAEHSLRVSCLSFRIAEAMGLARAESTEIGLAGALHDIGAFSLKERLDLLAFEDDCPTAHARAGGLLLKQFEPFGDAAAMVRHHHRPWDSGRGQTDRDGAVPLGSHILHLADRAVVLIDDKAPILGQVPGIVASINRRRGEVFMPRAADAFERAALKDSLWLELVSGDIPGLLRPEFVARTAVLDLDGLREFARLLCSIIDFKSEFTATHSSGVAAVGAALAGLVGFSSRECRAFEVAGYLHDLGKLAIPREILEKPAPLTGGEWDVMRAHVYYTYQILHPIDALGPIADWGALHQERLDGSGYPFRCRGDDLPLGARIMAVADIFTAVTENRPYRAGMSRRETEKALGSMEARHEIDGNLLATAFSRYGELDAARAAAQAAAHHRHEAFRDGMLSGLPHADRKSASFNL